MLKNTYLCIIGILVYTFLNTNAKHLIEQNIIYGLLSILGVSQSQSNLAFTEDL